MCQKTCPSKFTCQVCFTNCDFGQFKSSYLITTIGDIRQTRRTENHKRQKWETETKEMVAGRHVQPPPVTSIRLAAARKLDCLHGADGWFALSPMRQHTRIFHAVAMLLLALFALSAVYLKLFLSLNGVVQFLIFIATVWKLRIVVIY